MNAFAGAWGDCEYEAGDVQAPLASVAAVIQHPSVRIKPCTACHKPLPLSAYADDRRASDGRQSMCRTCQVTRRRAQRTPRRIANLLAAECGVMSRDEVYAFIAREAGNGRRVDRQAVIRMAELVLTRDANGARVYSSWLARHGTSQARSKT
jgi:hypothetical protein